MFEKRAEYKAPPEKKDKVSDDQLFKMMSRAHKGKAAYERARV